MIQRTLSIIKPDAVKSKKSGDIIALLEINNFTIVNLKKMSLTKEIARKFYSIHQDKPFFNDLINFMTSGPVIVQVLEKKMLYQNIVILWEVQIQKRQILVQ